MEGRAPLQPPWPPMRAWREDAHPGGTTPGAAQGHRGWVAAVRFRHSGWLTPAAGKLARSCSRNAETRPQLRTDVMPLNAVGRSPWNPQMQTPWVWGADLTSFLKKSKRFLFLRPGETCIEPSRESGMLGT